MSALVVGNGESRLVLDLSTFSQDTIIGCNALHRDITVSHLVCCDRKMVDEAIKNPNNIDTTIYTRPEWLSFYTKHSNVKSVPELPYKGTQRQDELWHWGSGPLSILLACVLEHNDVTIIGFDLWSADYRVNNVYKNTENYAGTESMAVDPSYWIYQIGKIFELYPNKKFTVISNRIPPIWKFSHVTHLTINTFTSILVQ
jgi:hypothetical protein